MPERLDRVHVNLAGEIVVLHAALVRAATDG